MGHTETQSESEAHLDEELEHHPTPAAYVKVAIVLAILTALEVGIIYLKALESWWAPLLFALMTLKFALVALWFMHLRFDSRIFRRLLILGIVLAFVIYTIVLLTFGLLLD
ncbi:MAG: cytochrome C oxidase subunit IV family protein [Acidimicrobiia bacterium]